MTENVVEAIVRSGWDPRLLDRRLKLWEQRAKGVPFDQICEAMYEGELQLCRRTMFNDWAAIRKVVIEAAAPRIEELKAKFDARHERVFVLAMAAATEAVATGKIGALPGLLQAATRAIDSQSELSGAVDRRAIVAAQKEAADSLQTASSDDLRRAAKAELEALAEMGVSVGGAPGPNDNGNGNGRR